MTTITFHSAIHVSGIDAKKFLQGQLSCDVDKLSEPPLGAHCNPKGRVLSLFWLTRASDGLILQLPSDLLKIAVENLRKYSRLFRGCALTIVPDTRQVDSQQWRLNNIQQGIPVIYAATSGLFLPHDLNLPKLGGVSFTKGCYTGQEIIARMQYLGKPKHRLQRLLLNGGRVPAPGDKICLAAQTEQAIGYLVDAVINAGRIEASAVINNNSLSAVPGIQIVIGTEPYEVQAMQSF